MADDRDLALARWQGGVDAKLETHDEQLRAIGNDVHEIRKLVAAQTNDINSIKRTLGNGVVAAKFRLTRLQVAAAILVAVSTSGTTIYLAIVK